MILVLKELLCCSNYYVICGEVIPRQVFLHIGEEGVVCMMALDLANMEDDPKASTHSCARHH